MFGSTFTGEEEYPETLIEFEERMNPIPVPGADLATERLRDLLTAAGNASFECGAHDCDGDAGDPAPYAELARIAAEKRVEIVEFFRASFAAVPASEPVALTEHDLGIIRDIEAMASAPNDNWWAKALALGASGLIKRLYAAAPAPVSGMPDLGEALSKIQHKLKVMLASATALDDGDCITGYQIKNGALHQILGVMAGAGYSVTIPLPSAATLGAKAAVEEAAAQMRNEAIPAIVAYRKGVPSPQAPDTPVAPCNHMFAIDPETGTPTCLECGDYFVDPDEPVAATLPAAPAPTEQADILDQVWQFGLHANHKRYAELCAALAARQAPREPKAEQAALPNDFLMPEDAWSEYATRSGLLNEHGVAPHPATAQAAYFAYQAAWNCLHKAFSAYIAARQAPTSVPKLDYDLLKLTLGQSQERLRQADEAIAKRDATALRVAQCAGEFARDAARFATAIALEDNAETLYSVVMSHAPDTDAIRRAFDAAIAQEKAQ